MSDKTEGFMKGSIVGMLVAAWVSAILYSCNLDILRRSAIEHGCAHYEAQTGKWQWNDTGPAADERDDE